MGWFAFVFWSVTAAAAGLAAAFIVRPLLTAGAFVIAALAAFSLVFGAILVFAIGGEPHPAAPLAERIEALRGPDADPANFTLDERIVVLRAIAADNPEDTSALGFLGDAYLEAGRAFEAVAVREELVRRSPPDDAYVYAALGEALVAFNQGEVTPEAVIAFERALERDQNEPMARWHLGLAAFQSGDRREAAEIWGDLLVELDPMTSARIAQDAIERLSRPSAPALASGDVDPAAMAQAVADPAALAEGMVVRLSTRLGEDGDDLPGWLTLARARAVLGDEPGVRAALAAANGAADWSEGERLLLRSAEIVFGVNDENGEG